MVLFEVDFGWLCVEVMFGFIIFNIIGVLLNFVVGVFVDCVGLCCVVLGGVIVKMSVIVLFVMVIGFVFNWLLFWVLVVFGVVLV